MDGKGWDGIGWDWTGWEWTGSDWKAMEWMTSDTLRSANGGIAKGDRMDPAERTLLIVTVLCIGFLTWLAWAIYGGLGVAALWLLLMWNYQGNTFPGLRG